MTIILEDIDKLTSLRSMKLQSQKCYSPYFCDFKMNTKAIDFSWLSKMTCRFDTSWNSHDRVVCIC